ncbi:hypothetical protein ACIBQ6_06520 [Nonomuraea sp. NPDC049655]|uniref:hypothetical protein n=1 Tax=Nonomuraea sp. NPDC049655 TaxID=3364355 RepID=UPI00378BA5FE
MNAAGLARDALMAGAGAAVTLSALGVPAAWPFVGRMYVHQYDPRAFFDGADTWPAVHDDVAATRLNVEALVGEVATTSWRSEDGRAFDRRMDACLAGLRSIEIRAVVAALVLRTVGAALVAMILYQFLVAAAMAALALWVLTAALTPLSLVAARTAATRCLTGLYENHRAVESLLDTLLHGCAARGRRRPPFQQAEPAPRRDRHGPGRIPGRLGERRVQLRVRRPGPASGPAGDAHGVGAPGRDRPRPDPPGQARQAEATIDRVRGLLRP